MLHKEIPFLRLGLPLCAGIITGLWFSPGPVFYVSSILIIAISFATGIFFNRYLTNSIYGISLSLALWLAGLILYSLEKAAISDLSPGEAVYQGILDDFPEEKEKTWKMTFKLKGMFRSNDFIPVGGSLLIYHGKNDKAPEFLPGDELIIKCSPVRIKSRGNPAEFDYSFYMENQGIRYYAFTGNKNIIRHSSPDHRSLKHRALIIREKILEIFLQRGISQEQLGLVAAMTLGQKNLLDPDQKQYFIKAGVMHIMAVSGLHTVILSMFIFNILFFLKRKMNIVRVIITLLILWAFAFVTGLTPSVLRATLMFSFLQAGKIMKREVNAVNSILASAFVLILIRPSVIFDAGFLLSYSAVIFIICFYRDLYLKIIFRNRIADLIWQSAAITIIAQAGTLPLTIMFFNRFPVWFILTNIIIVPLSSLVVITGGLTLIFFPLPFLSRLLAAILGFLAGTTEILTEKAASLPLSTIENIGITTIECALLTITIFLFFRYLLDRKSVPVKYPLAALLIFTGAGTIQDIPVKETGEIIVYNTIDHAAIGIRTGKILNCYSDSAKSDWEVTRHKAMYKLKEKRNILHGITSITVGDDFNILVTDMITNSVLSGANPDFVVLTGKQPVIERGINMRNSIKALVISPEVSYNARIKSLKADTVHFIKDGGAFYHKL